MPKGLGSGLKPKRRMDPCYEHINNAKRKHQHRAKLQVVNRRKAAREAISGSSQGSLFEGSRNVEIGGGQFSSAGGHHANFTINFNQSAMDDNNEEDDIYPGGANDAQMNPVMDNENDSRPIWSLQPLPVQRSCDIYYRHLAVKGRGSPLWLPEPSSTLPNVYRRQGIAVGDVGIITASGGFDFMFNVCLPADHPINQQGLPEGFLPLFPHLQPSDIRKHTEFNPNSHLASASVEKSHRESDFSGIEFTSAASEGAILTMPQGTHAEDLANVSRFRQYLSVNAESWYRYVNNVRGREARNGDVRLVVGCDKASSWGMATFANSTTQDFHLKFKPTGESGSSRTYGWEYSGMVEARAGPDPEETDELRRDDFGHSGVYKNQCLFVRTLNAMLQDDVWQGLEFDFETAMDIQYDSYPNSYIPSSSSGPSTRSPSPTGLSPSNSTPTYGPSRSSSATWSPQESLPSVYIAQFNTALTAHPSKTINDFMLSANPHARIAITEDKDWTSLIVESDQRLPPPEELINRMLTTHDVCEADGVVFLQLKQENNPTNNSSTNISSDQANHDIMEQPIIFEAGVLEPPSLPLGQTSVNLSRPNPDQIFASPGPLPSPLFLYPKPSRPTDRRVVPLSFAPSITMDPSQPSSASCDPPATGPQIRSRVTVVCAECKRLKLKCDRNTPCGSCKKRDTVSRCIYSPAAAEKVDLHSLNNRLIQVEALFTAAAEKVSVSSPLFPFDCRVVPLSSAPSITMDPSQLSSASRDPPATGPQIRSRVTVVCAECKRLKLRCDRNTPCGSCKKRDTVARCIYSPAAAEKVDLHSLNNRLIRVEALFTAAAEKVSVSSPFPSDCRVVPPSSALSTTMDPSLPQLSSASCDPPATGPRIRSRITVVCAECYRLKLRCDRNAPCGSCKKRDTVSRCIYSPAAAEKVDLHSVHNRLIQVEASLSMFMAGQTPPAFHPPGSFRQLDPRVDLPSVDPWASPPVIGGGSFSMNSPDTLVTEPPTLRPPLGEFDWGAELSNHPPVFPSLPGLEGCISTLNSVHRNINDIKVHLKQCRALSERCTDLLAALQGDLGIRSFYDPTIQEEIDRVITRLGRKVKEYGSLNPLKAFLRQQDIHSELSSLQTDLEKVITMISIFSHSRNAPLAHPPTYLMSERLYDYVPHEVKRRARTTRASLMALEEAFVSNPKPNAFLRKQLAKTIVMPERSVQVWFQNRRAKEKYRQRLLDKESVSDSELVTSTTPGMNRDNPLPGLDGSQTQHEGQIEHFKSLSRGLHLAHVQGTRYADLRTAGFVGSIRREERIAVKLTDFGFSTETSSESSSFPCVSPAYFAPEIIAPQAMTHLPPQTDVWAIGATGALLSSALTPNSPELIGALLSSALNPNSPELLGPEQNDLRRSLESLWEESTTSSTHADLVASLDGSGKSLRRKPHTINTTPKSTFPDDNIMANIMANPEDLNDGTSMSKGPEIGEGSLAEGC